MILFKNGRFHMGKAAFVLPDGFYVDNDIGITEASAFCAWDPEQKYLFRWRYFQNCEGSAEELKKWFLPDCGLTPLSEILPVEINGLTGHKVLYQSPSAQYCEARFDLGEGEGFVLRVESKAQKAEEIPGSAAFRAVWEGLEYTAG